MKELTFKQNSWHFWLAWNHGGYCGRSDFCHYVRCVLWGACVIAFFVALGVFATYCVGDWLGWIAACVMNWQIVDIDLQLNPWHIGTVLVNIALASATALGAIIGAGIGMSNWSEYRREKRYEAWKAKQAGDYVEPPPSFISQVWKSFKEKACYKIKFED